MSLWQLPADHERVSDDKDRNTYVVIVMNEDLAPLRQTLLGRGVDVGDIRRSADNEFVWFYAPTETVSS